MQIDSDAEAEVGESHDGAQNYPSNTVRPYLKNKHFP